MFDLSNALPSLEEYFENFAVAKAKFKAGQAEASAIVAEQEDPHPEALVLSAFCQGQFFNASIKGLFLVIPAYVYAIEAFGAKPQLGTNGGIELEFKDSSLIELEPKQD